MNIRKFIIDPPGYVKIILLFILSLFHLRYGIIPSWTKINSDFPNYYTSSRLLLEGKNLQNIYDDKWFQQRIYEYGINEPGKFSPFPPPTVFVMFPEALFSPLNAKRIFITINILMVFLITYLIIKITGFSFTGALNIILLSGAALINNFLFGQFYLVLLLLILLDYYLFTKENEYSTGIFWGIAAAIKYVPVIYLLVVIIKKKWKTLFSLIISIVLINIITILLLGKEVYIRFFQTVLFSHLNGNLSSQSEYAVQFQSWNSFLRNVFVYDNVENNNPLINSILLFNITRVIIYSVFMVYSGMIIYRIRKDDNFVPYSFIILTLLLFVLTPASASYHLLLLVFPIALLLKLTGREFPLYCAAFLLLYILISFSPFIWNKTDRYGWGLISSYSRLWLEVIDYIISAVFITNTYKLNQLSKSKEAIRIY